MKNNRKIPTFKSIREEAEFWDNNDAGDFMDELKIVDGVYSPSGEVKTTMTIRLDIGLKEKIDQIAKAYDISASSLVRMWMVDRLRTL